MSCLSRARVIRLSASSTLRPTQALRWYASQSHPNPNPAEEFQQVPPQPRWRYPPFATPIQLKEWLDGFVVGQDQAKKVLATTVYFHYIRLQINQRVVGLDTQRQILDTPPHSPSRLMTTCEKSNVMMIGPTGSGKTFLFRQLLKVLSVPYSISDATSFTQAGYVGEDADMCIQRLFENSNYDAVRTSQGIVFIDEIDKIARKTAGVEGMRDVGGEGVQQSLLKLVEGREVTVKGHPNSSTAFPGGKAETYSIDTKDILFIVSGAFVGLDDIVKKRVDKKSGKGIGFHELKPDTKTFFTSNMKSTSTDSEVEPADLQAFGFIPEFVSRFPSRVSLLPLTDADLYRILADIKGSLVSQATAEFGLISVDLRFTTAALKEICAKASRMGGGARGLRTVMEEVLLSPRYEVPGSKTGHVLITLDTVRHHKMAIYWDKGNERRFYQARVEFEEMSQ